jgi:hypothetical protein
MSPYALLAFIAALAVGAFLAFPNRDDRRSRWAGAAVLAIAPVGFAWLAVNDWREHRSAVSDIVWFVISAGLMAYALMRMRMRRRAGKPPN